MTLIVCLKTKAFLLRFRWKRKLKTQRAQSFKAMAQAFLSNRWTVVLGFTGDGFTSLAMIYASFSLSNWFAPSVVALLGPKLTMVAGKSRLKQKGICKFTPEKLKYYNEKRFQVEPFTVSSSLKLPTQTTICSTLAVYFWGLERQSFGQLKATFWP